MDLSFNNTTISAVAFLPDCVFAATDQGLWVSRDQGACWQDALASMGEHGLFAVTCVITMQEKNQTVVVAGVHGGFLRSEDGGLTWAYIALPSPQPLVTALTADARQVLYAASALDGVFLSKDSGKSWVRWNFGLLDWHVYAIAASSGADGCQVICAGTETGVFYSLNQGRTWLESNFPQDGGAVLTLSAATGPTGGLVVAATETGGLYRSLDQGKTWLRCVDDGFEGEISPVVLGSGQVLALSQGQLFHSPDNGLHWTDWEVYALEQPVLTAAAVCGPDSAVRVALLSADRRIRFMDYISA